MNDFLKCMELEPRYIITDDSKSYWPHNTQILNFEEGLTILKQFLETQPNNSQAQLCKEKMIKYVADLKNLLDENSNSK